MNISHKTRLGLISIALMMVAVFAMGNLSAFAQTNPKDNPPATYTPLEPLPCVAANGVTCSGGASGTRINFQNYLQYAFNLFIFICAAAAVFMIVWGGFEYMTTDSWNGKSAGLEKAKNAVLGLLLVLTSYIILRTIDPRLVAIPTTLLKPLNRPSHTSSKSFLDQLYSDAAKYSIDITNFKNNIKSGQDQVAAANKEIQDLNYQLATSQDAEASGDVSDADIDFLCRTMLGDTDVQALCAKRYAAIDKRDTAQSKINLNTAEGLMRAGLQQCAVGNIDCLQKNNTSITNIFNKYNPTLQPADKAPLQAYKSYSASLLDISKELGDTTNIGQDHKKEIDLLTVDLATVTAAVKNYSSLPNADPTISSQMQNELQQTTATVNDRIKIISKPPCLNIGC